MVLLVCKTSDFWIKSEFSLGLNSLGCRFYPFIPWSILCHSLLACQVSAEKTRSPYGSCLVCNLSCLSFAAFNILFNFCLIEIAVFLGVFLLDWSSLGPGGHSPSVQFSSVQSLSRVQLFVTSWIAARQASLSITNSWSLLKLMSIESVIPSSHLILCRPFSSCPSPSQHQGVFQWVNSSHEVAKVLEFQLQHQSFQWTPRTDLL